MPATLPKVRAFPTIVKAPRETPWAPAALRGSEPDQATRVFLRYAIAALMVASLASIVVNAVFVESPTPRLIFPLSTLTIVATSWWLLRNGYARAGLLVLCLGAWVAATWIAAVSGGVRSSVIISYPLMILLSGWLLGARLAILMAACTVGVMLTFALLDAAGRLGLPFPSHTATYLLVEIVICGLAAALITYLLRSQAQQIATVRELTTDLVTQRTLAGSAATLRRSEELLDRTGHLARVGGWAIDVGMGVLSWTRETYRIHGREAGQPVTVADFIDCYADEARAAIDAALQAALHDGEPFDLELSLRDASGRKVWVRHKGEAQREDGSVALVIGAVQDVTEQTLTARTVQDSLNNLRCTLEVTEDGIFGYDDNDPDGRLLFANDRFYDIWRMPRARAADTRRSDVIAAARKLFPDPDRGVQRIREILAMGVMHEDKVPLNDGRVLFRRSIPLAENSQVTRVWSFRDITAEERLKEDLQASRDEAQRASKAKSTFLANMSHELRTPMNAIIGMTALALRRTADPRLRDHLAKIDQASAHLLDVINDILDISKIEAERMSLERVEFRLDTLFDKVEALLAQRAAEKRLSLAMDLPEELRGVVLLGDPVRLTQILANLGGNAVKFTEAGHVAIAVRQTGVAGDARTLRFEVSDSGIGISAEDRKRLFAVFEQADNSMTRKYGGTGLGLAICKRLVELMGGEIDLEGEPGRGSTFWFEISLAVGAAPVPAADSRPPTAATELRARFAGAPLLLAEDEPINMEVALGLLEETGLRIDTVEDGAQALERARQDTYRVILMDVQMPVMTGIEATRAIREASMNRETPIVAMTANAFNEDRAACLAAGMNDHVGKPVDPETLYRCLLRWLAASARDVPPG